MNMHTILHAFVISVTDCWVVLLLLLSLYCIDLFSCKAASVFIINLLTYLLRWQRIEYKLAAITFKTKQSGLPGYLYDRLHDYQPSRTLRSSTACQLQRQPLTTSFADRSFAVTAPTVWNSLSLSTRSANTFGTFKSRLKTELFMSAYTT